MTDNQFGIRFDQDDGPKEANLLEVEFFNYLSPLLFAVMLGLAAAVKKRFDFILTFTCVNRSVEQNGKVGGVKYSGHLSGYAVDLRTRDMPVIVRQWIIDYLNTNWAKYFLYVIYHNDHLHVGVSRTHHSGNHSQYGVECSSD